MGRQSTLKAEKGGKKLGSADQKKDKAKKSDPTFYYLAAGGGAFVALLIGTAHALKRARRAARLAKRRCESAANTAGACAGGEDGGAAQSENCAAARAALEACTAESPPGWVLSETQILGVAGAVLTLLVVGAACALLGERAMLRWRAWRAAAAERARRLAAAASRVESREAKRSGAVLSVERAARRAAAEAASRAEAEALVARTRAAEAERALEEARGAAARAEDDQAARRAAAEIDEKTRAMASALALAEEANTTAASATLAAWDAEEGEEEGEEEGGGGGGGEGGEGGGGGGGGGDGAEVGEGRMVLESRPLVRGTEVRLDGLELGGECVARRTARLWAGGSRRDALHTSGCEQADAPVGGPRLRAVRRASAASPLRPLGDGLLEQGVPREEEEDWPHLVTVVVTLGLLGPGVVRQVLRRPCGDPPPRFSRLGSRPLGRRLPRHGRLHARGRASLRPAPHVRLRGGAGGVRPGARPAGARRLQRVPLAAAALLLQRDAGEARRRRGRRRRRRQGRRRGGGGGRDGVAPQEAAQEECEPARLARPERGQAAA